MTPAVDTNVPGGIKWSLVTTTFALAATGLDDPAGARRQSRRARHRRRLLVDDAAGSTTLVTVTAVANAPATLGGLTDSVTVLTVTPAVPAAGDLRYVTIYELAGSSIPFWGYAYPERVSGGTVLVPGRLREHGGVEVGRIIKRNTFQPGVELTPADVSPGEDGARRRRVHRAGAGDGLRRKRGRGERARRSRPQRTRRPPSRSASTRPRRPSSKASSGRASRRPSRSRARTRSCAHGSATSPSRTVELTGTITTLVAAASALQAALRNGGTEPEWTQAQVYWQRGRLLVFPGGKGGGLELLPTDTDGTTVRELGLDADQAGVLRGAPLRAAHDAADLHVGNAADRRHGRDDRPAHRHAREPGLAEVVAASLMVGARARRRVARVPRRAGARSERPPARPPRPCRRGDRGVPAHRPRARRRARPRPRDRVPPRERRRGEPRRDRARRGARRRRRGGRVPALRAARRAR